LVLINHVNKIAVAEVFQESIWIAPASCDGATSLAPEEIHEDQMLLSGLHDEPGTEPHSGWVRIN